MPYSIVHSEIAFRVKDFLNYKTESQFLEFIAGNILVDCSYELKKIGYDIERHSLHYYRKGFYEIDDFPEIFWEKEGKNTAFFTGYYFHLLTDKVWRDSSFLKPAYTSKEEEKDYQISRKLHSSYDLVSLERSEEKNQILEKLYKLRLSGVDIPQVLQGVDTTDLEKVFYKMLNYMLGKDIFVKDIEDKNNYEFKGNTLSLKDPLLQKKVEKKYPYEEYNSLKKQALDEFQIQMRSKIG